MSRRRKRRNPGVLMEPELVKQLVEQGLITKEQAVNPDAVPRAKYGNKKTTVDGIVFASRREAARYGTLSLMAKGGYILDLVLQPRYPLRIDGALICTYVADFRYFDVTLGREVVEDAKGFRTPEYVIKKKLMLALYGVEVKEV